MKKLYSLIAWLLIASSALGANVRFYVGPSGQTTYVRVEKVAATTYIASALTEGSSGGLGNYTVPPATLVSAGLSTASTGNGFPYTVRVGTPSTTAADPILGYGDLMWDGSTEVTLAAAIAAVAAPDTRDLEPVQFTWKMSRRSDGTIVSMNTLRIAPGESIRAGFDCDLQLVLPTGLVLRSMTTPTPASGDVVAAKLGVEPKMAKAQVTADSGATAGGTFYVRTTVINSSGAGPITLLGRVSVVAEPTP